MTIDENHRQTVVKKKKIGDQYIQICRVKFIGHYRLKSTDLLTVVAHMDAALNKITTTRHIIGLRH